MAEDIEDTVLDALAVLQTVPRTEEEVPSTTRELEDVPEKEDEEKAEDREVVTYESEDGAGELEEAVAATKEEEGDAASKAVDWLSFLISYKHFFQPCTKCAPERMPYGRKRANVVRYCAPTNPVGLCQLCLGEHGGHPILQIRRGSNRDMVDASQVGKFVDCTGIHGQVTNSVYCLFLRPSERSTSSKRSDNSGGRCLECGRCTTARYCSLACKVHHCAQGQPMGKELPPGLKLAHEPQGRPLLAPAGPPPQRDQGQAEASDPVAFGRKRSRNDWTPEENSAFLEGIRMSASLDSMAARARAIAAGVGSRTENQCMQRFRYHLRLGDRAPRDFLDAIQGDDPEVAEVVEDIVKAAGEEYGKGQHSPVMAPEEVDALVGPLRRELETQRKQEQESQRTELRGPYLRKRKATAKATGPPPVLDWTKFFMMSPLIYNNRHWITIPKQM